jgi:hypothetical protein
MKQISSYLSHSTPHFCQQLPQNSFKGSVICTYASAKGNSNSTTALALDGGYYLLL